MSQYIDKRCADFSLKMHQRGLAGAYSAPQNSDLYLKGTDIDKRRERGKTGKEERGGRTGEREGGREVRSEGMEGEEGGKGDKEGRERGDGKSRSHGHF